MNSLLLDTHIILWWLSNPKKIALSARKIIAEGTIPVFVSASSIWEMSIKASLHRLSVPLDILYQLNHEKIHILDIKGVHAAHVRTLPLLHQDPFDRMLVAQAQVETYTLVTRDPQIASYPGTSVIAG